MKRWLCLMMAGVLLFACCSCSEKKAFTEDHLLFDLGATSFEDVKEVTFLYEDYQGDVEDRPAITQKNDIKILCEYAYVADYPSDRLHELFVFPTNSLYVTVGDISYQLHVGEDGSLTTVPNEHMDKARTYKPQKGQGFSAPVWEQLVQTYQNDRQTKNDMTALSLDEAYAKACEQYEKNPAAHRDVGERQSETQQIIEIGGKYYQSYVATNVDIRYVFIHKTEFPTERDGAEWDWFTIGTANEYSSELLGKMDEGRK